jgi:hypothetical protein
MHNVCDFAELESCVLAHCVGECFGDTPLVGEVTMSASDVAMNSAFDRSNFECRGAHPASPVL